jgi:hypothetical protein
MEAKEKKKPNQKEDYRLTEATASWKWNAPHFPHPEVLSGEPIKGN